MKGIFFPSLKTEGLDKRDSELLLDCNLFPIQKLYVLELLLGARFHLETLCSDSQLDLKTSIFQERVWKLKERSIAECQYF